jgi:hypothetical protein
VPYEKWNIFRTLAQSRDVNGKDIQAIEEIGMEDLLPDHRAQVSVRTV